MKKILLTLALIVSTISYAQSPQIISTNRKVDLGLSVYWSGYNLGTTAPEKYGSYFAWGEIDSKELYNETTSQNTGKNIGNNICGTGYDAAHKSWGGAWRLPSWKEWQELIDECTWEWTTYKGVNGYIVTGPNGNSIFLPANGYIMGNEFQFKGERGVYHSGTAGENHSRSYNLSFGTKGIYEDDYRREYGLGIRPVQNK